MRFPCQAGPNNSSAPLRNMLAFDQRSTSRAARSNVHFSPPIPVIRGALGRPMKRVKLEFGKSPAHRTASRIGAFLHNVRAFGAANLLREEIGCGVIP